MKINHNPTVFSTRRISSSNNQKGFFESLNVQKYMKEFSLSEKDFFALWGDHARLYKTYLENKKLLHFDKHRHELNCSAFIKNQALIIDPDKKCPLVFHLIRWANTRKFQTCFYDIYGGVSSWDSSKFLDLLVNDPDCYYFFTTTSFSDETYIKLTNIKHKI